MRTFLYTSDPNGRVQILTAMIQESIPEIQLVVIEDIQHLNHKILFTFDTENIVVLFCQTEQDIKDCLSISGSLSRAKIILLLPDLNSETVKNGYNLYPRFVSWVDGDLGETVAVLKKISNRKILEKF